MLLERESQMTVLTALVRGAQAGDGAMALIGGEAGVGKTTLVEEFTRSTDVAVVVGACDPLTTPRPLGPLRDFIDVGGSDNLDLFHDILDRYGSEPTVMVLEDVHWADQATLDFIRFVGRRVAGTRLLVVCTHREDEVGSDHPLRVVLGQLARLPSTVRIDVPRLSLDAVRRMTSGTSLDPARLHARTAGNAFFVTELIAAAGEPSASVCDAVLARVVGLPTAVREVIETVSVSPRSLGIGRALALGCAAGDIDAAVASGVVVAADAQLRFRHDLARVAVESAIAPARAHDLHRLLLDLLLDEADPDHARLAHHAIAANASALVAEHAPIAAAEARQRGSTRETAAFYQAAFDAAPHHLPADDRARLRIELGIELAALDEPTAALEHLAAAAEYFRVHGADLDYADAVRHLGRALSALGRPGEALRCAERAVAAAEPHGPSEQLVWALGAVAGYAMLARKAAHGAPIAARAATMASELSLTRASWAVEQIRACLDLVAGDVDRGIATLRGFADAGDDVLPADRLLAVVNLGSGAGEVRRYATALDALTEAEAAGVAADDDAMVAYARAWLARVAFERGEWDDAVAYASLVEATATNRRGYSLLTARGVLGRVRVRRGDPGGAELLEDTIDGFRGHELQYRWSPVAGLAEHHWLRGDRDAMVAVLAEPYAEALDTDSGWARGELGYWMWKAGQISAPPAGAAAPFEAQIAGRVEDAVRRWQTIGCPFEAALAQTEGSAEMAVAALGTLDRLGARPLAERVRSDLRSSGVGSVPRGPTAATQAHPLGLTARQAEVLDLIVEGLSNAEIADQIYVSKKTVEHHVSAVFAKLGVETRPQAIVAARRAVD